MEEVRVMTMYPDRCNAQIMNDVKKMKSRMTLDFASGNPKQMKLNGLLASPDMNLLKLASPDLERMIIQQNGMVTTTPTPTQFLFPRSVTEEQEAYARGFVDALAELHKKEPSVDGDDSSDDDRSDCDSVDSMSVGDAPSYTTLTTVNHLAASNGGLVSSSTGAAAAGQAQRFTTLTSLPGSILPTSTATSTMTSMGLVSGAQDAMHMSRTASPMMMGLNDMASHNGLRNHQVRQVKEEPQTVPCLTQTPPPFSPINMETQEVFKLERKRARNRVAARKCRTRKLERISRLEDRVNDLKGENTNLTNTAASLRNQVAKLKQQIMGHVNSGCKVMLSPNLL